jgi:hypothetical protein
MEVVKNLDRSHEELPGVVGAERSEGDGGNWGALPAEAAASPRTGLLL